MMSPIHELNGPKPQQPKLLDQVRMHATVEGFGESVVADFVQWSRRFILFQGMRHPRELGASEVGQFLAHVAKAEPEPLPALDRAGRALDFLFHNVLARDLGEVAMPKPPRLLD